MVRTEKMDMLREKLSQENALLWSASLYAGWLNTLRPLLKDKGEGYPVFMQNEEWNRKNAQGCGYIQYIREHAQAADAVFPYAAVNKILHDSGVNGKSLKSGKSGAKRPSYHPGTGLRRRIVPCLGSYLRGDFLLRGGQR